MDRLDYIVAGHALTGQAFGTRFLPRQKSSNKCLNPSCEK